MSELLYYINIHYEARELDEISSRERIEQALSIACTDLEKYNDTTHISYKIREIFNLE